MGMCGVDSEKGSGVVSLGKRTQAEVASLDLTVQGEKLSYTGPAELKGALGELEELGYVRVETPRVEVPRGTSFHGDSHQPQGPAKR